MKKSFILLLSVLCLFSACKKDDGLYITKDGAINAAFSVSADRQVRFSKGNLQYQATTNTFRFAEHQYDRIGGDNENISAYYGGWIDLFGWATSGWDCGNEYYHPYDHEYVDDYELGMGYGPLPSRNYDLVGEYANCDWGVYNAISNGGNKPGLWRTLTAQEWKYLFRGRPYAESKFGAASIEGYNGCVVLPDEWTLPEGCTFNPGMGDGDGKEYFARKNLYTLDQWTLMEKHGAVFLPATGVREIFSEISYVGEVGRYWSVSRVTGANYDLYLEWCAFSLYFDSQALLETEHNNPRDYGRAVRLVQDIKILNRE